MTFNDIRFANIMNAARAIAIDRYAVTAEDINHICISHGFSLYDLTDSEIDALFAMVNDYRYKGDI